LKTKHEKNLEHFNPIKQNIGFSNIANSNKVNQLYNAEVLKGLIDSLCLIDINNINKKQLQSIICTAFEIKKNLQ